MGRLEAYQDMERYLQSMLPQVPRYESPQYIKQALAHCQTRMRTLSQAPVASNQDNVEAVKRVADKLKEQRDGRQQH